MGHTKPRGCRPRELGELAEARAVLKIIMFGWRDDTEVENCFSCIDLALEVQFLTRMLGSSQTPGKALGDEEEGEVGQCIVSSEEGKGFPCPSTMTTGRKHHLFIA